MGGNQPQRQAQEGHDLARIGVAEAVPKVSPAHDNGQATRNGTKDNNAIGVTRRSDTQRRKIATRNQAASVSDDSDSKYILPSNWWVTGIAIALSLPFAALVSTSIPPISVIIAAFLGTVVAYASRKVAVWERSADEVAWIIRISAWTAIGIPLISLGYILGYWALTGELSWVWTAAGMLTANMMCSALLVQRTPQQVTCLILSSGTIAVIIGSFTAISALVSAAVIMALLARYQMRVNHAKMEVSQARERERNRAEDILRDYEETGQGWFWETDRRGLLTYLSPSVLGVLDKADEEVIGRPFIDLFDLDDDNKDGERTLTFHLSARSSFQELGARAMVPGEARWWSISGRPAYDSFQNFVGFRGSGTDLTEKKKSAENVNRLAQYDSLTNLANRFQMQQTLEKILKAPLEQHRECSVFLLDLDRFKHVNDTLGHPAGDALLKQVAQRLIRSVGKMGRVGRLGGDEFEVLIPGRSTEEQLGQLAYEIIHSLS